MPAADASGVLHLPAQVNAAVAAAIYREWAADAARLASIDFSQVQAIDSAGVALVRVLSAQALRAGSARPGLVQVPLRYTQLCLAHRIEAEGN